MINFLEASHYKILCAVCEMDGKPKPSSPFSQYIEQTRDKQVSMRLHSQCCQNILYLKYYTLFGQSLRIILYLYFIFSQILQKYFITG